MLRSTFYTLLKSAMLIIFDKFSADKCKSSHPSALRVDCCKRRWKKKSLSDSIISLAVFQCVDTFQHLARVVREDKTSTLRTVSVKFPSCGMIAAGGEHRQRVSLKKSFCLISQAARLLPAIQRGYVKCAWPGDVWFLSAALPSIWQIGIIRRANWRGCSYAY